MGVRKRNRYTAGFRAEAVKRIVEDGLEVSDLAKSLKVNPRLIYRWVRAAAGQKAPTAPREVGEVRETLDEEVRRLRRENAELRMEKAILKKATAFFAKESENK
jgi:transposase